MPPEPADVVDVLIVGAGLSGIGAAAHLQQKCLAMISSSTHCLLSIMDSTLDAAAVQVRATALLHCCGCRGVRCLLSIMDSTLDAIGRFCGPLLCPLLRFLVWWLLCLWCP